MTPVVDGERRGADNMPAEGRRTYDTPDLSLDRLDAFMRKIRRVMVAVAGIVAVIVSSAAWFGYRAVGPGTRVDELDVKVGVETSARAYGDSVLSARVSRLERLSTTQAYQSCISDGRTPATTCAKIFTDGI